MNGTTEKARGMAMAIVLMVIAIIAILGGALVSVTVAHMHASVEDFNARTAFYAANAGVEQTLLALETNSSFSAGFCGVAMQNVTATFSVSVTNNAAGSVNQTSSNNVTVPPGFVYVLSTGIETGSEVSRRIGVLLKAPVATTPFVGVYAGNNITLSGGSFITSFNSKKGALPSPAPSPSFDPLLTVAIGSTAKNSICFKCSNDKIYGNALDPAKSTCCTISKAHIVCPGTVKQFSAPYCPTPVPCPTGSVKCGVKITTCATLCPGNYRFLCLSGKCAKVTLKSGCYYFPGCPSKHLGVNASGGSQIIICAKNGPVRLTFGCKFCISGGSIDNPSAVAGNFVVSGTKAAKCSTISGGSSAYMVFNSPNSPLTISGSHSEVMGSFTAASITDSGGATMYVDDALGSATSSAVFTTQAWQRL